MMMTTPAAAEEEEVAAATDRCSFHLCIQQARVLRTRAFFVGLRFEMRAVSYVPYKPDASARIAPRIVAPCIGAMMRGCLAS